MTTRHDIIWLEVTDSTNNRAAEGACDHGDKTTWVADFQTAGRGQRGNKWSSRKSENLMFTVLFKPDGILPQDQFIISEVSALGVVRFLARHGVAAKIKWPNDIYVGDRKICGILIEHAVTGEHISSSISGIGVNLNQREFPEGIPNPTSLALLTGKEYDRKNEMENILDDIFHYYDKACEEYAETGSYRRLNEEYLSVMYRIGEYHRYIESATGREFEAKIIGMDRYSCLLLEDRKGVRESYPFKEISYVI